MLQWVFADTSGLIGRFLADDPGHAAADREVRRLLREGRRFLTTNYVFDEVVTRARRLAGYEASRRIGDAILSSDVIHRLYVDERLEAEAWRVYHKLRDHELSFTDASSMAVMRLRAIQEVFSFDRDFERAGFLRLPRRIR